MVGRAAGLAPKTLINSLYHHTNDFYDHCTAIAWRALIAPSAVGRIGGTYRFVLAAAANRACAARGARNRGDAEFAHHTAFAKATA
jgi:hypothetical protein